jgi:hypothetical protein
MVEPCFKQQKPKQKTPKQPGTNKNPNALAYAVVSVDSVLH